MSPTGNRRWITKTTAAAAVAVLGIVSGVVYTVVSPHRGRVAVLSLLASRDLGALPPRGTAAGQFCGSVGTIGAPEHCYEMQEAAGNLTDSVGGLTLTAAGTPRYGVVAGLPVQSGGSVEWTSEKGIALDGSGRFTGTDTVAAVASYTVVWQAKRHTATQVLFDWGHTGGAGVKTHVTNAGVLGISANFGTARTANVGSFVADDGAIHCMTLVVNGASTTGWIDRTVIAWAWPGDPGTTVSAQTVAVGSASGGGSQLNGTVYRHAVHHGAAVYADHQALCGDFGKPLRRTHPAYSDTTWTQTGGARCFAMSATTATCLPGGATGYAWDSAKSAISWAVEPGRVNRLLQSSALNNWTVTGNPELLTDRDMEAAGVGSWTAFNSATLSKDTTAPLHGGAQHLRVAHGGTNGPAAYQVILTLGSYYTLLGYARSDGTWVPRIATQMGYTGGIYGWVGTTSTAWQTVAMVAMAVGNNLALWHPATAAGYCDYDDVSVTLHGTPTVAPDGSKTAYTLASTATITSATATGYGNDAPLFPRVWLKCTGAATVTLEATVGAGEWTVDCSHASLSGSWALIGTGHAAVTEVTPWAASAGGTANFVASGTADFSLWLPTLAEKAGYSVIPTLAAAVATGDAAWPIDNSLARYWQAGDTVTQTLTETAGTCLATGDPLRLSGAVGSECQGLWRALEIRR